MSFIFQTSFLDIKSKALKKPSGFCAYMHNLRSKLIKYICTLSKNYRQLYCIKQSSFIEFPVNPSDCCLNSKVLVIWGSIIP